MYLSSRSSSVSCWPALPCRTASKSSTPSSVLWSLTSFPRSRWQILFSVTRILRKILSQASALLINRSWAQELPSRMPGSGYSWKSKDSLTRGHLAGTCRAAQSKVTACSFCLSQFSVHQGSIVCYLILWYGLFGSFGEEIESVCWFADLVFSQCVISVRTSLASCGRKVCGYYSSQTTVQHCTAPMWTSGVGACWKWRGKPPSFMQLSVIGFFLLHLCPLPCKATYPCHGTPR